MERKDLYITELIFNLNRFVEEAVVSHHASVVDTLPDEHYLMQKIVGEYKALTGMYGKPEALMKFAAEYSKFEVTKYDDLCNELLSDFLNLHNGLFVVNLSDSENIESTLEPPLKDCSSSLKLYTTTYIMPVDFSFGTVNFILSE